MRAPVILLARLCREMPSGQQAGIQILCFWRRIECLGNSGEKERGAQNIQAETSIHHGFLPQNVRLSTNVAVFSLTTRFLDNFNKFPRTAHRIAAYPQIFPQKTELLGLGGVRTSMRLLIKTRVSGNYQKVFAGFDESLLLKLTPPGMKLRLVKADPPDQVGGGIHLHVTVLGIIRQEWKNDFHSHEIKENECHFVDVGRLMPFPFKYWRHDHRVQRDGDNARIVDDITYRCRLKLLEWLVFPIVWLQFRYRRPIYRRHFGKV